MIEDSSIATTSEWIWDSIHSLYYNSKTSQYASPQLDGSWIYSEISSTSNTTTKSITTTNSKLSQQDSSQLDQDYVDGEPYYYEGEENESEVVPTEEDRWSKVPMLRLVVSSSTVLHSPQTIVLVDPSEPLSFGRDRVHTPRVRLKELEVSKSHAVLFWLENGLEGIEGEEGCWGVADSGSMHGTYLKRQEGVGKGKRLSEAKNASAPSLIIGTTRFTVHIHAQFACEHCTVLPDSSNLIPLHSAVLESTTATTTSAPTLEFSGMSKAEKERSRKEKMKGLKDKYFLSKPYSNYPKKQNVDSLSNNEIKSSTTTTNESPGASSFVDRSAARRLRTGAPSTPIAPNLQSPFFQVPGSTSNSTKTSFKSHIISSQPSMAPLNPFDSTSRGAQLLAKISSSNSNSSTLSIGIAPLVEGGKAAALGTLIQAKTFARSDGNGREEKPGLGSRNLVIIGTEEARGGNGSESGGKRDWREEVRERNRKRFKEME